MHLLLVLLLAMDPPPAPGSGEEVEIGFTCALLACTDEPQNEYDQPACAEFNLDEALIESLDRGDDASAVALLESRFATATTFHSRHRIAAALLGRAPNDTRYWDELRRHSERVVGFPRIGGKDHPDFLAWCAAREVDPDTYRSMATHALNLAGADRRARPLLLRALKTSDEDLVRVALEIFGLQRDQSVLPTIAEALDRLPREASSLAHYLAIYQSDAADALAMKHLLEEEREQYLEVRHMTFDQ